MWVIIVNKKIIQSIIKLNCPNPIIHMIVNSTNTIKATIAGGISSSHIKDPNLVDRHNEITNCMTITTSL